MTSIRIKDIPGGILPCISDSKDCQVYLTGKRIKRVFIFRDQYRVVTERGEYRYPLDTDITIEVY